MPLFGPSAIKVSPSQLAFMFSQPETYQRPSRRSHRSHHRDRSRSRSRSRSRDRSSAPHNPYRPDRDDERQFTRIRQVECTLDHCTFQKPHFHEAMTMPTPPPPAPSSSSSSSSSSSRGSKKKRRDRDDDEDDMYRFPFHGMSSSSEFWRRMQQFMEDAPQRGSKEKKIESRGFSRSKKDGDKPELLLKVPGTYYKKRSVEKDELQRIMDAFED
ncbi:hypothetical protein BJ508DRAFT_117270 [Ascobolus immersus RN42]|uniref:Uncharacterized protein n=1 Tax=Ascobolus immersus RN42 TaxID=1160509 RepID=A0A3N4I4Y7_ASCIM|nr:hypothetical protein BJ508DRAFT_117270 [Ascobolus immersus RN42]